MGTEVGVYFRQEDYASTWRRLLIASIDGALIYLACAASFTGLYPTGSAALICAVWTAICFSYMVLLKHTKIGTLGYRLCGVRIVGIDGQRPAISSLTLRALFVLFGPINYCWDFLWIPSDTHRQALRDKFASTYVVKRRAEAMGSCRQIHRCYWLLEYNFLFRELELPKG